MCNSEAIASITSRCSKATSCIEKEHNVKPYLRAVVVEPLGYNKLLEWA